MASEAQISGLDFGEDLFNFDELLRELPVDREDVNAALDAVIETTAPAAVGLLELDADPFALAPPAALPAPTHRVQPKPPPLGTPKPPAPTASVPIPVAVAAASEPAGALPAGHASTASLRRVAPNPALIAVLVLMAALNLALMGYVVRALGSVESMVLDVGGQVVSTAERARSEATALAGEHDADAQVIAAAQPEGLSALDRAREFFDAGSFERGRQTLFALLAVIDRVPADVRPDIEARARFMLADSWRLEADARQSTLAVAGAGPEDAE